MAKLGRDSRGPSMSSCGALVSFAALAASAAGAQEALTLTVRPSGLDVLSAPAREREALLLRRMEERVPLPPHLRPLRRPRPARGEPRRPSGRVARAAALSRHRPPLRPRTPKRSGPYPRSGSAHEDAAKAAHVRSEASAPDRGPEVRAPGRLEHAFPKGRLHRTAPGALITFQQELGRRAAGGDRVEGGEMAGLVGARLVAPRAGP